MTTSEGPRILLRYVTPRPPHTEPPNHYSLETVLKQEPGCNGRETRLASNLQYETEGRRARATSFC
jgi:hypothetical protein